MTLETWLASMGPEEMSFNRTELDSKIRVVTERIPEVRSVSLGVSIDTGSRDENENERGLTHFIEHLLFKGTPDMNAKQIAEAFDFMGADLNAATGREFTSIYSRVVDQHLPRAVEIIMDMAQRPLMDDGDINSERQVLLEEVAMHMDSPDELVHDHLAQTLWGDHPLGHMVLGDARVVSEVSREKLLEFRSQRYIASRIVIAAAGSVDHDKLCDLISKNTGAMQAGGPTLRDNALPGPATGKHIFFRETEQAHICIGSKGIPRKHPERFTLAVMDNILGGSMSSRLFQSIREEKGLAYSIYSYHGMFLGMGMVGVYCGTQPGQAQKVIELIEDELVLAREKGFTREELGRAKNHIEGSLLISLEDSGNRMSRLSKAELARDEHMTVDQLIERVRKVTLDDLNRVFSDTWGSTNASLAVVGPFEEDSLSLSGRI